MHLLGRRCTRSLLRCSTSTAPRGKPMSRCSTRPLLLANRFSRCYHCCSPCTGVDDVAERNRPVVRHLGRINKLWQSRYEEGSLNKVRNPLATTMFLVPYIRPSLKGRAGTASLPLTGKPTRACNFSKTTRVAANLGLLAA